MTDSSVKSKKTKGIVKVTKRGKGARAKAVAKKKGVAQAVAVNVRIGGKSKQEKEEKVQAAPIITVAPTFAPQFQQPAQQIQQPSYILRGMPVISYESSLSKDQIKPSKSIVSQSFETPLTKLEQSSTQNINVPSAIEQRGVVENSTFNKAHKSIETTGLSTQHRFESPLEELRNKIQTYSLPPNPIKTGVPHRFDLARKEEERKVPETVISPSKRTGRPASRTEGQELPPSMPSKKQLQELIKKYNTDNPKSTVSYSKLNQLPLYNLAVEKKLIKK